ncbi:MAG TPA: pyridoxal phosphate-dependent aminotransferase family protein, partial [Anaerolineae bacterium]|nr:pyridoxal phosphate-dependent aminotransferase family protein [Anaerolineae bacterium]
IQEVVNRIEWGKQEGVYYYMQPVEALDGAWVVTEGRRKLMFATYNYLGLLKHPKIVAAAQEAEARFGTGTHGVRLLGGTIALHKELEDTIARFHNRDDAIVYSSGYVTNLATISTLTGRGDWVFSDRWNHASIVDGCLLSRARFARFRHNDMADLERQLHKAPADAGKLVVVDAVFSMDGDICNLPALVDLCHKYGARLMVDEAHSLGVLGEHGRGIEEHFGMEGAVDIKMGTLSKTIPSVGGYITANQGVITYLKHTARGFVFSAALPPGATAAAKASFEVIEEEGQWRRARLQENVEHFISGLKACGFDTGLTETPIVPIMTGTEEAAIFMTKYCQENDVFVLPVLPPAVPPGSSRLRANVTTLHTIEDIDYALGVFEQAGKTVGLI